MLVNLEKKNMNQLRIKSNKSFRINKIAIVFALLSLQIIFLVVLPIRGDSGSMGTDLFLTETGGDDIPEVELLEPIEPMVFEGNVEITTPDLSYEGPAEFHILEHEVSLNFNEELFNWNIIRYTDWGCVESYLCYGNLGRIQVSIFHTDCRTTLVAAGYQQPMTKVLFSGSIQIMM
jgi:hypothetical protein